MAFKQATTSGIIGPSIALTVIAVVAGQAVFRQVDNTFQARYLAAPLEEPQRFLVDPSPAGPSSLGRLRWDAQTPLTVRTADIRRGDLLKLKLATEEGRASIEVAVDRWLVAVVEATETWHQFEILIPIQGSELQLRRRGDAPSPVHLSRLSLQNYLGGSTGPFAAYMVPDAADDTPGDSTLTRLGYAATPAFLALLCIALARSRPAGSRFASAFAAIGPGAVVTAAAEIAGLFGHYRVVFPGLTLLALFAIPALVVCAGERRRPLMRAVVALAHALGRTSTSLLTLLRPFVAGDSLAGPRPAAGPASAGIATLEPRRREVLVPLSAGLLVATLFFAQLLLTDPRIPLAPGDGWLQNLPARHLLGEELRAGRLPLWNPFIFSGFPLLGDIQVGALYPLNWVFAVVPSPLALNLGLLFSFLLAVVLTYGLARSVGQPPIAAIVAGTVFAFSGYMIGNIGLTNHLHAAAWLPGVLWMAHRFVVTGRLRYAGLTGGALALQFFAGHTQTSAYTAISVAALLAFSLVARRRTIGRIATLRGGLLAAAIAFLLALPQLLSTLELTGLSTRTRINFDEFRTGTLEPIQMVRLVLPYFVRDNELGAPWGCCLGATALTLAVLAWRARRRGDGVALWAGLGLFAAVLGAGPGWPVVGRLLFQVPVIDSFRMPSRWLILFNLTVAVLAGFGVARIMERGRERRPDRIGGEAILSLVTVLAIATVLVLLNHSEFGGFERIARSLVHPREAGAWLAVAGLALWSVAWRWSRAHTAMAYPVLFLILVELYAFGRHAEWVYVLDRPLQFRTPTTDSLTPESRSVAEMTLGARQRVFTLQDQTDWGIGRAQQTLSIFAPNTNLFTGVPNVSGYSPLAGRLYLDLTGIDRYGGALKRERIRLWLSEASRLPDVLAARWLAAPANALSTGDPLPVLTVRDYAFVERPSAMPRAWFAGAAARVPLSELRAWLRSDQGAPSGTPADCVLFLTEDPESGGDRPCVGSAQGSVVVDTMQPARTVLTVESEGEGWVVLSEAWYPGWKARVDRGPWRPVLQAYGLIQASLVPAGRHRVEFAYRPLHLYWSFLGPVAGAGLLGASLRRRRRPAHLAGT